MIICAQHYSYLYRLIVLKFAHDGSVAERLNRLSSRLAGVVLMILLAGFVTFAVYNISEDNEEVELTQKKVTAHNLLGQVWWCVDDTKIGWLYTISAFFVLSQLINLFGGIVIIRMIKSSKEKLTPDTYKMHMSLSVVLLIQGTTPFLCIFIPLFHITTVMHFHRFYESILIVLQPVLTKTCIVLISLFPMINAILNIVFIKPYRNFAIKLAKRICCCCKARRTRDIVPLAVPQPMHRYSMTQDEHFVL
ncbi:serpentine type 7TM GPCR chemoreceptor srh domain-containing protein [Ditylenchus destructor]|nr:serpentine type 7TM GPCR chemoreceptor srh domain-containing protein [Ditylenchus destructor]